MTRLRFLLVSLFASFGAVLGIDREKMARKWFEDSGFKLTENGHLISVWHPRAQLGFAFGIHKNNPSAFLYLMERMKALNFTVTFQPTKFVITDFITYIPERDEHQWGYGEVNDGPVRIVKFQPPLWI